MIEESYVSLETARLLKEAGFDVPCTSQYTENEFAWENLRKTDFNKSDYVLSRPTQALAARWLREVHGIHASIDIFMDSENDADGKTVDEWTFWSWSLFDSSGRIINISDDRYDTYEEALEGGLKDGLKLIKK